MTKLIVGLGNPESRFDLTRHNIGFEIIDALASHYKATHDIIKMKNQSYIAVRYKMIDAINVIFLKPMDWMNSSGIAVGKVARTLKIDSSDIIIIYDDMDFDFGIFKIKIGGSSGKHNGVQSVIDVIGTKFVRFRFGVGRPMNSSSKDYVLSKFDKHEQKYLKKLRTKAVQVVDSFIMHGAQKTMNVFNKRK